MAYTAQGVLHQPVLEVPVSRGPGYTMKPPSKICLSSLPSSPYGPVPPFVHLSMPNNIQNTCIFHM
ncbi:hypothetical protein Hanom_Chr09g00866691 [Helianthus anomalus]